MKAGGCVLAGFGIGVFSFLCSQPMQAGQCGTSLPAFGHVILLVEENHSFSSVIGIGYRYMPFLNYLASQYGLATQYYANGHPSWPNYTMLLTGSTTSTALKGDNLIRQLVARGISWKSYVENLPSPGFTRPQGPGYDWTFNPPVLTSDVQTNPALAANLVPISQFLPDLGNQTLPRFTFLCPSGMSNTHDGTFQQGNDFLMNYVGPLLASPLFQPGGDGLLLITYDEAEVADTSPNGTGGGHVATIVVSPKARKAYQSTTFYQHQNLLALMAQAVGLCYPPGAAAGANNMEEFFQADASTTISPSVSSGGVLNAASFAGGSISAGEILSIFGSRFSDPGTHVATLNTNGFLPNTLAQTQVLFNHIPAPLLFATPSQVNLIVPYEVGQSGAVSMTVQYQGISSLPMTLSVSPAAPGIFATNQSGAGPGAILNQDYSLNSSGNPAQVGSVIMIFGTGAGPLMPPLPDGSLTPNEPPQTALSVTALVGGLPANILYSGGAPGMVAGGFQVNVQIPQGVAPSAAVPVILTFGNFSTQTGITLAVGP